jgi:hypothetical protein
VTLFVPPVPIQVLAPVVKAIIFSIMPLKNVSQLVHNHSILTLNILCVYHALINASLAQVLLLLNALLVQKDLILQEPSVYLTAQLELLQIEAFVLSVTKNVKFVMILKLALNAPLDSSFQIQPVSLNATMDSIET